MCSRLFWNTNKQAAVVTRSMDWALSFGERLVAYPRGLEMSGGVAGHPARWTSRYGSVCALMHELMAQFGLDPLRDGVVEGVNEKGFAAHLLYLDHTRYEERDDRPGVPTRAGPVTWWTTAPRWRKRSGQCVRSRSRRSRSDRPS